MAALCPVCQVFPDSVPETLRQFEGSYFQNPTCSHPLPRILPPGRVQAECLLCAVWHMCVEQVLDHRAAWRDQKSEIKPHGPNRDVLGLLGPLGHLCPPLLLNRITSYSQRVLIRQDLPSTICDQFQSLAVSGLCHLRRQEVLPNGPCIVWGGALCSFPSASEVCLFLSPNPTMTG